MEKGEGQQVNLAYQVSRRVKSVSGSFVPGLKASGQWIKYKSRYWHCKSLMDCWQDFLQDTQSASHKLATANEEFSGLYA